MTYLNITAYHFCLRFFIYSTCTTLHTQLIPLRKHATKRQNFEEIKRKGKRLPFPPFVPSFLHFAIMLTKLRTKPNLSGISSGYQYHWYGKKRDWYGKSRPSFSSLSLFILSITHSVQPTPLFWPTNGHLQGKSPTFSSILSKERLIWKKAAPPFFLTLPL